MVSIGESPTNSVVAPTPPSSKPHPRSMRTVRSTIFQSDRSSFFSTIQSQSQSQSRSRSRSRSQQQDEEDREEEEEQQQQQQDQEEEGEKAPQSTRSRIPPSTETLTDSVIDFRLVELASLVERHHPSSLKPSSDGIRDLDISQALSDFSAYSSDISGELQRLAALPRDPYSSPNRNSSSSADADANTNTNTNTEATDSDRGSPLLPDVAPLALAFSQAIDGAAQSEGLDATVDMCVKALASPSIDLKRSAAAKLRILAKNRPDNRAVIGAAGAIPGLIPLLRCGDPLAQEHAATALLNLSLHEENKAVMTGAGAIKALIFSLKTGTATAKQNSACALLSLSLVEENRMTIGACGAIPPLVALLRHGTNRGKKDALTTLYKLCAVRQNKERAVSAGVVKPLVDLVGEMGCGTMEKAMVVLSSLAAIPEGRTAIVEENGIPVLVEAIEGGSGKGKEFAVLTLLQLCGDSVRNRGLLVREGGIPPLVALSQTGTARAKQKAETLLRYLREPRQEAAASSP